MLPRWAVPAALALLVLPVGAQDAESAWTQLGGDAGHTGVSPVPLAGFEVLRVVSLTPPDREIDLRGSLGMVETPHGLMWLDRLDRYPDAGCRLHAMADPLGDVTLVATFPCNGPYTETPESTHTPWGSKLVGYDAARGRVLLCLNGDGPQDVLVSVNAADGQSAWAVSAEDLGEVRPLSLADYEWEWSCNGVALDPAADLVYAAVSKASGRHRIAAIALDDGAVVWSRTVGTQDAWAGSVMPGVLSGTEQPNFDFWSITTTANGLVVLGRTLSPTSWMFATLTRDGVLTQLFARGLDDVPPSETNHLRGPFSAAGAAQGHTAAFVMQDQWIRVDPSASTFVAQPLPWPESPSNLGAIAPVPLWWGDHLIIAGISGIADVDPLRGAFRWQWNPVEAWEPADMLLLPPEEVLVLALRADPAAANGKTASLLRIGLDGSPRQEIPLPFTEFRSLTNTQEGTTPPFQWSGRILPLSDGRAMVFSQRGQAVLVGQSPDAAPPVVLLDSAYPQVGAPVKLRVEATGDVDRIMVGWGDGVIEAVAPGAVGQHTYTLAGERVLRVTTVFADGTTRTSEATVLVGGQAVAGRSFLAAAFDPEYQEITLWIIGLTLTSAGSAGGLLRLRRRHNTLSRTLDDVERAHAGASEAERPAVLLEQRRHVRELLERRRITDTQYATIRSRIDELEATGALMDLQETISGSHELADLRLRFMQDGRVSAKERDAFRRAVAADESLDEDEKKAVLRRLSGKV